MISSTSFTSPLPTQKAHVILHHEEKSLVSASIVPLDIQNSRLFADWELEDWEQLRKLEWYRRPFVQDLLFRQRTTTEKTFVLLTRLADFDRLLVQSIGLNPSLQPNPLFTQIQAALTVEVPPSGPTVIYNIESAPWNKFGPERRFVSLPAAALFFFAAQHYLSIAPATNRFILSHPTADGVIFYQKKLQLNLRWSSGLDRYAVVERESLLEALVSYEDNLEMLKETLPVYTPE